MKSLARAVFARLRHPQERGPSPVLRDPQHRESVRALLQGQRRLHLGCGTNVLSGWANLDLAGPPPVIEWDLTQPLPMDAESCDAVYTEHFIEHITNPQARALLTNCQHVLRRGGIVRLSTPSLEKLVSEYQSGRLDEWRDMQWLPKTSCQLLNEGMRLWGHQYLYDWPELRDLLRDCGFASVERVEWRQSRYPDLRDRECRPFHQELIVEATK